MRIYFSHSFFSSLIAIVLFSSSVIAQEKDESAVNKILNNATYFGVYDHAVKLNNGRWEGKPFVEGGASRPSVGIFEDFRITGDLDGDGVGEHVIFLWAQSGGTGTQNYLAVMSVEKDKFVNSSTALIGDRVQLRSGRIINGKIELGVIQQGDDDPACCPGQKATRVWSLDGKKLIQEKPVLKGRLSLSDLEGVEWILAQINNKDVSSENAKVSLIFNDKKITGKVICNRYFSEVKESGDMGIRVMPIGSTKMLCPGAASDIERSYFGALNAVTSYGFLGGKLALYWQKDESTGVILFSTRESNSP